MASPDANDVIVALRDQVCADYGRLNIELALARAENATLRATLRHKQEELTRLRQEETDASPD